MCTRKGLGGKKNHENLEGFCTGDCFVNVFEFSLWLKKAELEFVADQCFVHERQSPMSIRRLFSKSSFYVKRRQMDLYLLYLKTFGFSCK